MQETTTLRERNRLATWQSINDAAAELVLECGVAAATTESIAERAGCSRRTFFNYFQTKEDAILGMSEPRLDIDEIRVLAAQGEGEAPFERTMRILIHILNDVFPAVGYNVDRRRQLLSLEPTLKARFVAHISAAEELVLQHLQLRADEGEHPEAFGPGIDHQQAKALLMLAGTIVRFAVSTDPDGVLCDRESALRRATTTFREVIEHTL